MRKRAYFIRCYKKETLDEIIKDAKEFAYILHNKDTTFEAGELKKPHYHIVARWKDAKQDTTLRKISDKYDDNIWIGEENKGALAYLTHQNDQSKHQYKLSEVVSSGVVDDIIDKAENLSTAYKYVMGEITAKEMFKLNPEYIFKASSLKTAKGMIMEEQSNNADEFISKFDGEEVKS